MASTNSKPLFYNVPPLSDKPKVLLLSLLHDSIQDGNQDCELDFAKAHSDFLKRLSSHATVYRITGDVNTFSHWMQSNSPLAIIVTDEFLIQNSFFDDDVKEATKELKAYIGGGGTVIFIFCFEDGPHRIEAPDVLTRMRGFWKNFGKDWDTLGRRSDIVYANPGAIVEFNSCDASWDFKALYCMNGVFLGNVAKHELLYEVAPDDEHVGPVTWAKYGSGKFGYVGEIGTPEDSVDVILAMCGF